MYSLLLELIDLGDTASKMRLSSFLNSAGLSSIKFIQSKLYKMVLKQQLLSV